MDAGAVALSRDEKTCRLAGQRFAAHVPTHAFRPLSGQVYVYAIGRSQYFVVDPEYSVSEHLSYGMLFTRR